MKILLLIVCLFSITLSLRSQDLRGNWVLENSSRKLYISITLDKDSSYEGTSATIIKTGNIIDTIYCSLGGAFNPGDRYIYIEETAFIGSEKYSNSHCFEIFKLRYFQQKDKKILKGISVTDGNTCSGMYSNEDVVLKKIE